MQLDAAGANLIGVGDGEFGTGVSRVGFVKIGQPERIHIILISGIMRVNRLVTLVLTIVIRRVAYAVLYLIRGHVSVVKRYAGCGAAVEGRRASGGGGSGAVLFRCGVKRVGFAGFSYFEVAAARELIGEDRFLSEHKVVVAVFVGTSDRVLLRAVGVFLEGGIVELEA